MTHIASLPSVVGLHARARQRLGGRYPETWPRRARSTARSSARGAASATERFHGAETFHYVTGNFESLEWALEVHDSHNERIWKQAGPVDAADVVLKSDEYKPGSVGWQMEQTEVEGPRRSPAKRRR